MSYINYENDRDIRSMDMNKYPMEYATVYPRNIYGGYPVPYPENIFEIPRDSSTLYISPTERSVHPPFNSRFGKGDCPNGYCTGHRPGKYTDSMMCDWEEQPSDMAPSRFYRSLHTDVYTNFSDARVIHNVMNNNYILN